MKTIYDFSVKDQNNHDISLQHYQGKILLVVNTATKCGLTKQYDALEKLYQDIGNHRFEILDFPCNQFMNQAPGSNEEINEFCALNFGTSFPRFDKIDVNGENTSELYKWLKSCKPDDEGKDSKSFIERILQRVQGYVPGDISWNFTKFLIDGEGHVVHRYSPTVDPSEIKETIQSLL